MAKCGSWSLLRFLSLYSWWSGVGTLGVTDVNINDRPITCRNLSPNLLVHLAHNELDLMKEKKFYILKKTTTTKSARKCTLTLL